MNGLSSISGAQFRRALAGGAVCSLAYGAAANILTFVLPALYGPAGGSLAGPLVLQAIITGIGVASAFALASTLALTARTGIASLSKASTAGLEVCGLLSLGIAALALGAVNREFVLMACAILTIGVAVAGGSQAPGRPSSPGALHADAWAAVALLVFVPWLADGGPFSLDPRVTAVAALGMAGLFAAAWLRYRPSLGARLPAAAPALALALALATGLFGSWLLQAENRGFSPAAAGARDADSTYPNVVLIVMDTVRADHTTLHGYRRNTTPGLHAEWLAGATRYTKAIAASDWTLPSTASLLTGQLATNHRAITRGASLQSAISPEATTLAERLGAAGYRTWGVVANHGYLSPHFGFGRGFDVYSCRRSRKAFGVKRYVLAAAAWRWLPAEWRKENRSAGDITDRAARLLQGAGGPDAAPFFLFLNYMDAHIPYLPPDRYRQKFGEPGPRFSWGKYRSMESAVLAGARELTPEERRNLEADYDAGIAYIDDSVRRIFDELRRLGLFDDTMVIVTSDHGEMFGEAGIIGHGAGLLPELVHVPLLVKYPGQREAATVDDVVSGTDIFPTVMAAAGLKATSQVDGHNLMEAVPPKGRVAIAESFEIESLAAMHPRFTGDERAAFAGTTVYRILRDARHVVETWPDGVNPPPAQPAPPQRSDLFARLHALERASDRMPLVPVRAPGLSDTLRALGYLGR
jgi:arylsulfatase A-like enzyme